MRAHAPLQIPRALVVTALVLGLAASAHTAGGGHLPPAPVFALLAVLMLLPVTVLTGRRLTFPALAGVLGAGQILLHNAFTALPGPVEHCTATGLAAHTHHQALTIPECASGPVAELMAHGSAFMGPAMLAAHILAVTATALLLAHGEAILWRMLAWLAPATVIDHPAPLPGRVFPGAMRTDFSPPRHPCLRIPALRGPPRTLTGPATAAIA